jgi:phenylacetate-CoA ligase
MSTGHADDLDRPFWDVAAQTRPNDQLQADARAGLEREWARVWDLPVDFYRRKFEAAGLGPDSVPELDDIPRTTKDDLRADEAANPPLGTFRTVGLREARKIGGSTGTTGTPTIMAFGPTDKELAVEHMCRVMWRYGVRPGDSFTHSWPQGFYMSSTFTALWFDRVPLLEIPVGPPMGTDQAKEHLRLWQRLRPDGFMMTSSQLQTYEDAAEEERIDLADLFHDRPIGLLDAIFQFEGPRRRLEAKYGFRIHNMGGVGEIPGYGPTDCRHHTGVHVPGDMVVPQVVDPATGKSLPDGERGHMVVTIHGYDQLILRYDIEDICTMTWEPCPCGETGPRFTLLGRAADAVTIDGLTTLPIDAQLVLHDDGAPDFQFAAPAEQDGRALRLKIEGEGDAARHQATLQEALGVPVEVEEVPLRSLPRSTFKPRRVSS